MRRAFCIAALVLGAVQVAAPVSADPLTLTGFIQGAPTVADFAFRSARFDLHHYAPGEFFTSLEGFDMRCVTEPCAGNGFLSGLSFDGVLGASGQLDGQTYNTFFREDPEPGVALATSLNFLFPQPIALPPASAGVTTVSAPFVLSGHFTARPAPRYNAIALDSDVSARGSAQINVTFASPSSFPPIGLTFASFDEPALTPEPTTWVLMSAAVPLLAWRYRRRSRR